MLRITLMLAAYRADHGTYPEELDDVTPDYFIEVPIDPFVEASFHYQRTETSYPLYSVGENVSDDGGQTCDSWLQRDSILIETPPIEAHAPVHQ